MSDATDCSTGLLRQLGRVLRRALLSVALLVVLGNVAILGMSVGARVSSDERSPHLPGINHLRIIDDRLWRGDAPSTQGYQALATAGVTTVVDLRPGADVEAGSLAGMRYVHLPIRDGQTPTDQTVDRFLETVATSDGPVYLHCSAGVGRTGTLVAAYLTHHGVSPLTALHHNLSVGPPSLEQVSYVLAAVLGDRPEQPGTAITALSRILDTPRRLFTLVRHGH